MTMVGLSSRVFEESPLSPPFFLFSRWLEGLKLTATPRVTITPPWFPRPHMRHSIDDVSKPSFFPPLFSPFSSGTKRRSRSTRVFAAPALRSSARSEDVDQAEAPSFPFSFSSPPSSNASSVQVAAPRSAGSHSRGSNSVVSPPEASFFFFSNLVVFISKRPSFPFHGTRRAGAIRLSFSSFR